MNKGAIVRVADNVRGFAETYIGRQGIVLSMDYEGARVDLGSCLAVYFFFDELEVIA